MAIAAAIAGLSSTPSTGALTQGTPAHSAPCWPPICVAMCGFGAAGSAFLIGCDADVGQLTRLKTSRSDGLAQHGGIDLGREVCHRGSFAGQIDPRRHHPCHALVISMREAPCSRTHRGTDTQAVYRTDAHVYQGSAGRKMPGGAGLTRLASVRVSLQRGFQPGGEPAGGGPPGCSNPSPPALL
jgi:hypothetical protein